MFEQEKFPEKEVSTWLHGYRIGGLSLGRKEDYMSEATDQLRHKLRLPNGVREVLDEVILQFRAIATNDDPMDVYSASVIRLGLGDVLMEMRKRGMGHPLTNEEMEFIVEQVNQKVSTILDSLRLPG